MNFFEQQQRSRRDVRRMAFFYALAVIAVVLVVNIVLDVAWRWGFPEIYGARVPGALYAWGVGATLVLVLGATAYHVARLRKGGDAIARLVGARRVLPDRRLLNVVEEMAIAAGTRVPAVYVMPEEPGINAFAAGFDLSNSTITVTRGTVQTLNREELAGVIGHEFSHIVRGDVRLNLRMMGVLGGLLAVGLPGKLLARLIKAVLSRQREFLADAASVQFTRNPVAIAGALDQLRVSTSGTRIVNRYAENLSHMFFGQGVAAWAGLALDSHPPLEERIRRVLPNFGAAEYRARRRGANADPMTATVRMAAIDGKRAGDQAQPWSRSLEQSVALVGALEADKVDYAQRLMGNIPSVVRDAVRKPATAPAAVLALMLAGPPEVMARQLEAARESGASGLAEGAGALLAQRISIAPELQLTVVDLAIPTLKSISAEARRELLAALEAVIQADRRVSPHAFVILALLRSQLTAAATPKAAKSIPGMRTEALLILSLIVHAKRGAGANADSVVENAFRAGARELAMPDASMLARDKLTFQECGAALDRMRALAPLAKAGIVRALFAAVIAGGKIRISEAELMRLVGASLDCPVPPLFEAL